MHIWRLMLVAVMLATAAPISLLAQEMESLGEILERQEGLIEAREAQWRGEIQDPRQIVLVTATLLTFASEEQATAAYPALVDDLVGGLEAAAGVGLDPVEVDGDLDTFLAREENDEAEREHIAVFLLIGPYVAELFVSSSAMLDPGLPEDRRDLLLEEAVAAARAWQPVLAATDYPVTGNDARPLLPPAGTNPLPSVSLDRYEDGVLFRATPVGLPVAAEGGLIAYISERGSLEVMRPDGTGRRAILSNEFDYRFRDEHTDAVTQFRDPAWSHDGSMLAVREVGDSESTDAIWVIRDGVGTRLPKTWNCSNAVFSPDNQRVIYSCWVPTADWDPATNPETRPPEEAFIASSAVDGSDQRVEVANPSGIDESGLISFTSLAYNRSDNTYLARFGVTPAMGGSPGTYDLDWDASTSRIMVLSPDFDVVSMATIGPDVRLEGPAMVLPGTDGVVVYACLQHCNPMESGGERPQSALVIMDPQTGEVLDDAALDYPEDQAPLGLDVSPDGSTVIYGTAYLTTRTLVSNVNQEGWMEIGAGFGPAWQPVPVEILAIDPDDIYNVIPDELQVVEEPAEEPEDTSLEIVVPTIPPPPTLPAMEAPDGSVAYIGDDGNVRVIASDGSDEQQVTFDAGSGYRYATPVWSSTGNSLAFVRTGDDGESKGILVLDDGVVTMVPGTDGCHLPAFERSSGRVVYTCWQQAGNPPESVDVGNAALVSSGPEGFDPQVLLAVPSAFDASGAEGLTALVVAIDVHPDSGDILLVTAYSDEPGAESWIQTSVEVFDRDLQLLASFSLDGEAGWVEFGPTDAWFGERSGEIIANVCLENCDVEAQTGAFSLATLDYDGSMGAIWTNLYPHGSPDGGDIVDMEMAWVREDTGLIQLLLPDGTSATLAAGSQPAWTSGGGLLAFPDPDAPIVIVPGEAEGATDSSVATEEVEEPLAADEDLAGEPAAGGWIAYIGDDGNVWVIRPDGSGATPVTTDAHAMRTYSNPTWSHDGTMLAFESNEGDGAAGPIMVLREGAITILPDTSGCRLPAFSADNSRVYYSCWGMNMREYPIPAETVEPQKGFLSSSAVDGSDQVNHLRYPTVYTDGSNGYGVLRGIDVRLSDGAIVLATENEAVDGTISHSVELYDASFTLTGTIDPGAVTGTGPEGPFVVMFAPEGDALAISACVDRCEGHPGGIAWIGLFTIETQAFDGWEIFLPLDTVLPEVDLAPDGVQWVVEFARADAVRSDLGISTQERQWTSIGTGRDPAWQPVPVDIAFPAP